MTDDHHIDPVETPLDLSRPLTELTFGDDGSVTFQVDFGTGAEAVPVVILF